MFLNSIRGLSLIVIALPLTPMIGLTQSSPLPPVATPGSPVSAPATSPAADAGTRSRSPMPLTGDRPVTGYRLGAGDQVDINVFDTPEVSGVRVVAPDGSLTLPLVGKLNAAGQTTEALAQDLRGRLLTWLKNPIVAVNINQFRPLRVNIAGEVRRPGPIQMRNVPHDNSRTTDGSIVNPTLPTLSTALIAAGGVTRDGDISQVRLKRGNQVKDINLWQGLSSEDAPQDELLQDGDAIYIPKVVAGSTIDPRMIAKSTLAPTTVRVRVVGEVKKPGEVDVTPSSTISSAVAIAGGPTDKARMEEVALIRLGADGKVTEQRMNLQTLQDSQQVMDGDVVIVPKSQTSNWIDIAGQVFSPLGALFSILRGK